MQPSADVDVALGAEAVEAAAQSELDAELDESIMPHVILKYHITAHVLPRSGRTLLQ